MKVFLFVLLLVLTSAGHSRLETSVAIDADKCPAVQDVDGAAEQHKAFQVLYGPLGLGSWTPKQIGMDWDVRPNATSLCEVLGSERCGLLGRWVHSEVLDNFNSTQGSRVLAYGHVSRLLFCDDVVSRFENHGHDALVDLVASVLGNRRDFVITKTGRMELLLCNEDCSKFEVFDNSNVKTAGSMWYVTISNQTDDLSYRVAIYRDLDGRGHLYQYTLNEQEVEKIGMNAQSRSKNRLVRLVTYNVWNTMPHMDHQFWRSLEQRLERYKARMDLLTQYIAKEDPDIIAFQEIRYDPTLPPGSEYQLEYIVREKLGYRYYVHQPAMAFVDAVGSQNHGGDEGVSIASKYPIVETDYLLLSREVGNPMDFHQRVCLRGRIALGSNRFVDVLTTHLSLNRESRDRSVKEMIAFAGRTKDDAVAQFIMGDFNAEPHSNALRRLNQGLMIQDTEGDEFRDLWLELHAEPKPRSKSEDDLYNAFTFPSDEPKKRIDLIVGRGKGLRPVEMRVIGQDPQEESSATKRTRSHKFGMVHPDAPLFASDHRGVLVDVDLSDVDYNNYERKRMVDCIATLSGLVYGTRPWKAEFHLGAYTILEEGGLKAFGAYDDATHRVELNGDHESCKIVLYEHGDYSGEQVVLAIGTHNLEEYNLHDKVSAFEILVLQ